MVGGTMMSCAELITSLHTCERCIKSGRSLLDRSQVTKSLSQATQERPHCFGVKLQKVQKHLPHKPLGKNGKVFMLRSYNFTYWRTERTVYRSQNPRFCKYVRWLILCGYSSICRIEICGTLAPSRYNLLPWPYLEGLSKASLVCTHNDNFPLQMQRLSYIRPANTSGQGISSIVIYVSLKEKG